MPARLRVGGVMWNNGGNGVMLGAGAGAGAMAGVSNNVRALTLCWSK